MSVKINMKTGRCKHYGHSWQPIGPNIVVPEKPMGLSTHGMLPANEMMAIAQFMQCPECGLVGAYCGSNQIQVIGDGS